MPGLRKASHGSHCGGKNGVRILADARHEIKNQLREVQRRMAREKRKIKAKHRTKLLNTKAFKSMCCLMVIAHGQVTPVNLFGKMSGMSESDIDSVKKPMNTWYEAVTDTPEEYYRKAVARADLKYCMMKASTFLAEYKLENWITDTNVSKGLTPSSESVLMQLRSQVLGNPFSEVTKLPSKRKKLALAWLGRWRRRWKCCFRRLPALEHMTAAEKYGKAGAPRKQPRLVNRKAV